MPFSRFKIHYFLFLSISTLLCGAGRLPEVKVIGESVSEIRTLPGSSDVISSEQIKASKPFTTNEALRKVSGVYVREESSGFGGPSNVSIRGIDGDRSNKVLLLQDGVPLALGPYSVTAAYYFPQVDMIDHIEVLKGSGSIMYGPQTIGGVLNFITPNPPLTPKWTSTTEAGSYQYLKQAFTYGGTHGKHGVLFTAMHKQGDGPRDNMPYRVYELSGKVVSDLSPVSTLISRIQLHRQRSKITYLGQSAKQFRANPAFNPVNDDVFYLDRIATSFTHQYRGFKSLDLDTTVYAYKTVRNWYRQDFTRDASGNVTLQNTNTGNNRNYDVVGIEPRITKGNFKGGLRLHYEREHYTKNANPSAYNIHIPALVLQDELRSTLATAFFGQYAIDMTEQWRITPGLRIEGFEQRRHIDILNSQTINTTGKSDYSFVFIPAIGTTYDLNENVNFFAGVHTGFAPPQYADSIDNTAKSRRLDAERSYNYEAGVRTTIRENHSIGATAFYIDYQNQVVDISQSSGVTKANAGKTRHMGLEVDMKSKYPLNSRWSFVNVFALMLSDARIIGDRTDSNGNVLHTDNELLPYAPQQLLTVSGGLETQKFTFMTEGVFVGKMRAYNINSQNPADSRAESLDGKTGDIPSYFVINLSTTYSVNKRTQVFATVKNLFNDVYIASRRPEGIFPGPPRQINFGIKVDL